jgi:3-oxoacyl-[acyl-carrier-protein] synthase-1
MDDAPQLYLSGMGMVNAIGGSVSMVWAAAGAGINRYPLPLCR